MHKSTVSLALSGKGLANGYRNPSVTIFSGLLNVGMATEKILRIQKEMSVRSFDAPLYTCPDSSREGIGLQAAQVKQMCRQRPRAIICAAYMLGSDVFQELTTYQNAGGIVVCYDVPAPLVCDQVIFDREHNAYQAAAHLLRHGHRRIGIGMSSMAPWLSAPADFPQSFRSRGFQRALEEYGAPDLTVHRQRLRGSGLHGRGDARRGSRPAGRQHHGS